MTTKSSRSPGCFRAYASEQKTLRAKLDQLLKWTRDLKSNIMKQSCKVLQTNQNSTTARQTIDQIHDDLDEYKRKLDRELGRIHDICDALNNDSTMNANQENLQDEIREALRRSPTFSSLEQHMDDDNRPRIRVKPREKIHPGQNRKPRIPCLSTDTLKRKASQPITLKVIDTSYMLGAKRRAQISAFKRSRSFTNVEHTETQLGMNYVEEDKDDLSWKPFGPKRPTTSRSVHTEQPSTSSNETLPTEKATTSSCAADNSSDEEFDVAWERRAKQKARKEAASVQSPSKRTVRFSPSVNEPIELIDLDLDLDETVQDELQPTKDQNNNSKQHTEVVNLDDDDDDDEPITDTQSQSQITITSVTLSSQQVYTQDDNSQIIDDSDDDEIIALTGDDIPKRSNISSRRNIWTASEIQVTTGNSQSQSLHNPYRIGIADPSIRSIFLPPPGSQTMSGSSTGGGGGRRAQGSSRKTASSKRGTSSK